MFQRVVRIIGVTLLLLLAAAAIYTGGLYNETHSAFAQLNSKMVPSRDILDTEKKIGAILFETSDKRIMKPANFLTRKALTREDSDSTLKHHLKRIILAKRLKATYSADQLLAHWLSTVYLGNNEYGLDAVAKSLFKKDASELSLEEAAKIAALVEKPGHYRRNPLQWELRQQELMEQTNQMN